MGSYSIFLFSEHALYNFAILNFVACSDINFSKCQSQDIHQLTLSWRTISSLWLTSVKESLKWVGISIIFISKNKSKLNFLLGAAESLGVLKCGPHESIDPHSVLSMTVRYISVTRHLQYLEQSASAGSKFVRDPCVDRLQRFISITQNLQRQSEQSIAHSKILPCTWILLAYYLCDLLPPLYSRPGFATGMRLDRL
jgi:hypothetical protein